MIVLGDPREFAGVLGLAVGASRRYDGPMGKSDRAFVFGALGLWIGLGLPAGPWLAAFVWIVAALLVVTDRQSRAPRPRRGGRSGLPS